MTPGLEPLLGWYRAHRRDLPWRASADPYAVLVSEAMLQQTRVEVALPYFERWMLAFPDLDVLADAPEESVLAAWAGLGYYARARRLQACARRLRSEGWPRRAAELRKLPGIGPYTAGAVASIAFGEAAAAVDGNVERVYARWTGDASAPPGLSRAATNWAERELRVSAAGEWNQALMELGALVCTPRAPRCALCPISAGCFARASGSAGALPTRELRPEPARVELRVWVARCGERWGLRPAADGEWWTGLWVFPFAREEAELVRAFGRLELEAVPAVRCSVARRRVTLLPALAAFPAPDARLRWVGGEELAGLGMPAPFRRALAAWSAAATRFRAS